MPEELALTTDRDFELVSLVFRFDPEQRLDVSISSEDIESLEDALDETLQIIQTVGDRGPGSGFVIQRRQLDLTVYQDRLEVRSQHPKFSQDVAARMIQMFDEVRAKIGIDKWRSIGHNYILPLSVQGTAIKHLGQNVLKDDLEDTLGYKVLGSTASIWIEVDESTLWLRLEPNRSSTTTNRIRANANFSIELSSDGELPESDATVSRLLKYSSDLDSILKAMGL